jgi:virginiamycin B lyase
LVLGPDRNMYISSDQIFGGGAPVVYKIDSSGTLLSTIAGVTGALTVGADGNLWAAEGGRIARFTTSGVITEFPIPSIDPSAENITAGSDGAVWFTESVANKLGRITTSGQITEYATPGADPQGIVSCPKACENAHGRLWFAEAGSNRIAKFEF